LAKVGRIELKIQQVEGFLVRVLRPDGGNARSDRTGLPSWPYERAARDAWTVADWKRDRFARTYPGFSVEVLDGDVEVVVAGQTKLETVRDSYED